MKYVWSFLITIFFASCASTTSMSVLYFDKYDAAKDLTLVVISPYGQLKIPGKWTVTSKNTSSNQYFFVDNDSVKIAVALQPWDKFEFSNNDTDVTLDNFVTRFYVWDSNYLSERTGGKPFILKEDRTRRYLIWRLTRENGTSEYFLFGLHGTIAYNLYVVTDKWDEKKKIDFLEKLYNKNVAL